MDTKTVQYFHYDSIDSTSEESKRLIDAGKIKETSVIIAEEQTQGKGTKGRDWISLKGKGIYLSIVHLPKNTEHLNQTIIYTKSTAIACVEAIKKICKVETKIKPINDIYAEGKKKLGGILVETRLHKNKLSALITGIGINTHIACRDLPWQVSTTSIEELMQGEFKYFSKENLIQVIIEKVCFWYNMAFSGQSNNIQSKYTDYLYNINEY